MLKAIKRSGDIFFAVDDRKWVLDGAAVRVSMVGFDDGSAKRREWVHHERGELVRTAAVAEISSALTADSADTTTARALAENAGISFMGDTKAGKFELQPEVAVSMLRHPNPDGRRNSEVVRRWINGDDLTGRPRGLWIVDYPPGTSEDEAALYNAPFSYITRAVKQARHEASERASGSGDWWMHHRWRGEMRRAAWARPRFVCTPRVAKHRLFVWVESGVLADSATIVFARDDDYFFGVLQSHVHEVWALKQGTRLESRPRYTPTTCFESFPFPWPPGTEPTGDPMVKAIAASARRLSAMRDGWLNPVIEDGQEVSDPPLERRTLTNLYNRRDAGLEQWLVNLHRTLDEAVFAAYRWPATLTDEEILEGLLAENLRRAGAGAAP